MPFLKSSQITGLSPKPIDVTGFTQSASEDLEGTYSQHEVLLADAFNVTDNVTISDNLILAKLSDDGNAITVTGDASTTRTISGSGSLEGSTFAQTPNASLTGMTGTLNATTITGVLPVGVTGGSGLDYQGVNSTVSPAFAVCNNDGASLTNIDTTYRKVEWNNDSGTNATSGGTAYVADHVFNIGGMFDLSNDWFLPTVAGYYCFSYYTNVHNIGADIRFNVRFCRSTDGTDDWYDRFFVASEQTSTAEQTNFGFTSGPVYMNGSTHRVFIMHQIHSGSYGYNKGSHQQGFRGWRVG